MGATCIICGPYGGHTGAMCARWEADAPDRTCLQTMGVTCCGWHQIGATCAIWELHALYGSHIHHMGGGWHHMVTTRNIWGSDGSRVSHVGAVCTILEADGTIWEPQLSYDGQMVAIWWPYGGHMGTLCAMWEPHAPYGGHMGAIWGPYGGHMGAIWELYGSHVHTMGGAPDGSCVQNM
jgi:hypothetical protein